VRNAAAPGPAYLAPPAVIFLFLRKVCMGVRARRPPDAGSTVPLLPRAKERQQFRQPLFSRLVPCFLVMLPLMMFAAYDLTFGVGLKTDIEIVRAAVHERSEPPNSSPSAPLRPLWHLAHLRKRFKPLEAAPDSARDQSLVGFRLSMSKKTRQVCYNPFNRSATAQRSPGSGCNFNFGVLRLGDCPRAGAECGVPAGGVLLLVAGGRRERNYPSTPVYICMIIRSSTILGYPSLLWFLSTDNTRQ
jgi:hypothetical protein